ncbi:MAG: hypothetical protein RL189_114 [Pseudomonadota bacterium]
MPEVARLSNSAAPMPPSGSCFVDANRPQFHKIIPTQLRAPMLGCLEWRVGNLQTEQLMQRRGWVQSVCTTVTTPEQIGGLDAGCERIFIPGEFSRQGDVLAAAAASGKTILLERGAFLAPSDMLRAVSKLGVAKDNVVLVESGSSFGYSDRVLDPRALEVLASIGCPLALNLEALTQPSGLPYEHRPQWIADPAFDTALIRTAIAFAARYLILPCNRELSQQAAELWLSARKDN